MKVIELSTEQEKIVDLESGQHLVLASPGTGRDRNLLLAEVRDYTISGPRNPVVVCFTSPLPSLLFFIHNSQLALNGGCFQAELPHSNGVQGIPRCLKM
jgi:hypothetical protein